MKHQLGRLLFLLATMCLCLPAQSQTSLPNADAPGEPSEVSTDLEPLRDAFDRVFQSLTNMGGMSVKDRPTLEDLQSRFAEYNQTHSGDKHGLMYELQLSMWLESEDRIEALFADLLDAVPDDETLGLAWANYYMTRNDYTRADRAYARLVESFPDSPDIRLNYARGLKNRNLYARAIEILGRQSFDYSKWPEAAALLSDSFFAEHRFDEAVATLEAIPDDLPEDKIRIKQAADASLTTMREYVEAWAKEQEIRSAEAEANDLPRAEIITNRGLITLELYENEAPNTVANFINLAEEGFYGGTTFHNVIPNFMSQGGDPFSKPGQTGVLGNGTPGYYIADEHLGENYRLHFAGSVSMANNGPPNTGGCQFFITHTPTNWLNGQNTVFGRVVEGLNIARMIEPGERIIAINIVRKRDHEYVPTKIPLTGIPTSPIPLSPESQPAVETVDNEGG